MKTQTISSKISSKYKIFHGALTHSYSYSHSHRYLHTFILSISLSLSFSLTYKHTCFIQERSRNQCTKLSRWNTSPFRCTEGHTKEDFVFLSKWFWSVYHFARLEPWKNCWSSVAKRSQSQSPKWSRSLSSQQTSFLSIDIVTDYVLYSRRNTFTLGSSCRRCEDCSIVDESRCRSIHQRLVWLIFR